MTKDDILYFPTDAEVIAFYKRSIGYCQHKLEIAITAGNKSKQRVWQKRLESAQHNLAYFQEKYGIK